MLRRAEKDSAGWRALMHMGRPEPVTFGASVIAEIVLLSTALLIVPLACVPTISLPSSRPAGCVSVIV